MNEAPQRPILASEPLKHGRMKNQAGARGGPADARFKAPGRGAPKDVSWIHTLDDATNRAKAYFPTRRDASRRRFSAARWLCLTSRMNKAAATTATPTQPPMMMNPVIPCIAYLRASCA